MDKKQKQIYLYLLGDYSIIGEDIRSYDIKGRIKSICHVHSKSIYNDGIDFIIDRHKVK